jgi:streptogramin lyase
MFARAFLIAVAVVSCEPASISSPPATDTTDGWEPSTDWPKLPEGRALGRVLGVAVDARGRVWLSHTGAEGGPPEILALDPESGELVGSIDAASFKTPHALVWDDEGHLWVTDDGANRVVILDEAGRVVRTLGSE